MPEQLTDSRTTPKDAPKERRKMQNRLAQRTYRQNQKAKMRALEAAVERQSIEVTEHSYTGSIEQSSPSSIDWSVVDEFNAFMEPNIWTAPTPAVPVPLKPLPPCENITIPTPHLRSLLPRRPTALLRAVRADDDNLVRVLIAKGANPEQMDDAGLTPLHIATKNSQGEMVDVFLELSNPNVRDRQGRSALFPAIANHDEAMVKKLLDGLVDPNQADDQGELPLHSAVDMGARALACLLIDGGAAVDA